MTVSLLHFIHLYTHTICKMSTDKIRIFQLQRLRIISEPSQTTPYSMNKEPDTQGGSKGRRSQAQNSRAKGNNPMQSSGQFSFFFSLSSASSPPSPPPPPPPPHSLCLYFLTLRCENKTFASQCGMKSFIHLLIHPTNNY